ncbi:MAG: Spy/CpxP family protein refolding chaperone [Verrucomicrobia bacterium]|nr:Spy/CpxP family protein refolding chaperone [Verrucomicrobiota bacterium]
MKHSALKTLALIAALCVAAPMLVSGADAPEGKRGAGKGAMGAKFDEALGKLNLTDEQKTKVEACKAKFRDYMQAHGEELKAAREETDPEKKRAAFKGVMEKMQEMRDGIRGVLTDDQKKKFDELLPARHGDGKGKGHGKAGGTQ